MLDVGHPTAVARCYRLPDVLGILCEVAISLPPVRLWMRTVSPVGVHVFGLRAVSSLALHVRCGSVLAATACRWEVCVREGVAAGSLAATARSARGSRGATRPVGFFAATRCGWPEQSARSSSSSGREHDLRPSDESWCHASGDFQLATRTLDGETLGRFRRGRILKAGETASSTGRYTRSARGAAG